MIALLYRGHSHILPKQPSKAALAHPAHCREIWNGDILRPILFQIKDPLLNDSVFSPVESFFFHLSAQLCQDLIYNPFDFPWHIPALIKSLIRPLGTFQVPLPVRYPYDSGSISQNNFSPSAVIYSKINQYIAWERIIKSIKRCPVLTPLWQIYNLPLFCSDLSAFFKA